MAIEIKITSDGSQRFSTVLDGKSYTFNISYNRRMNIWTCTISSDGIILVSGVTLVGGVDILNQFTFSLKYLFIVNLDDPTTDANGETLGIDVRLFKLTESEVASIE
tara:strand:+ start:513 stop:833 length:321 start_codon:yes stop_codon:yes gene_type:complete